MFVLSLATLPALTYVALRQHTPPQFAEPASPFSWRWWVLPHERNVAVRPAVTDEPLYSAGFVTPQSGWALGWNGTILHTDDGGETWNPRASNTTRSLFSVAFATTSVSSRAQDWMPTILENR